MKLVVAETEGDATIGELRNSRFRVVVRIEEGKSSSSSSWKDADVEIDFRFLPTVPDVADDEDPQNNQDPFEEDNSNRIISVVPNDEDNDNGQTYGEDPANEANEFDENGERRMDVGEIGKSAQAGGGDRRRPSEAGLDAVMDKPWFFPVVGVVGAIAVLTVAVAVYAGIRRRAASADDAPAGGRMDRHRVGQSGFRGTDGLAFLVLGF